MSAVARYEGGDYDEILRQLADRLKITLEEADFPEQGKVEPAQTIVVDEAILGSKESRNERPVESEDEFPKILIATPVKDAKAFLTGFWQNLKKLSYPASKLSLAFLESDSRDGTYEWIEDNLGKMRKTLPQVHSFKRDYAFRPTVPRWESTLQLQRRSILARSRNYLVAKALRDEDWVLWIDVDVASWPDDVIQQMLATRKEVVTPNCLSLKTKETFDLNTFKLKPGAELLDWSIYTIDGIVQPPIGFGRLYLSDMRQHSIVELDGVGGTMLLVKADLHREGLIFPPVSYRGYIETEGLAFLARDMGYHCWGMPNLEVFHP